MPFTIRAAEFVAPDVRKIVIQAPHIAVKRKAGQFIVLRVGKTGERIPLTIVDSDPEQGTIALIVQGIGKSTRELNNLKAGEQIEDVVGPLGRPSEIEAVGTVVVIGGGVGTAVAYPTAKALKAAGNRTIAISGARSKNLVVLENELRSICDEVYITTDDGSYGYHGFVTAKLQELIDSGLKIDLVLAVGPLPMMKAVEAVTRPHGIPTTVSLNPVMVDGIGMCGGCRATVGGKTVFVCVDGPEFDAHQVDFDSLMLRNRAYLKEERQLLEMHKCRLMEQQPG
ncbi:MAG: sulfide/dihydroorotate dehydrogenase-like FAD/NAD-binding protein [Anaerolineaceae bacterium]|jgi:ferredoxin--NADP+ reductase